MRQFTLMTLACAIALIAGCSMFNGDKDSDGGGDSKANRCYGGASNWRASVNRQPTGPARLIVVGDVEVTSGGCRPELVFKGLDKAQPPGLRLKLNVHQSDEIGTPAMTTKEVRYESVEHTTVGRVTIQDPKGRTHVITEIGEAH